MSDLSLIITADGSRLRKDVAEDIAAVNKLGATVTSTSAAAANAEHGLAAATGQSSTALRELGSAATKAGEDTEALRQGFDADIIALQKLGKAVDVTNKDMVAEFRASVTAQRELMMTTGASASQFVKLDAAVSGVSRGVKATSEEVTTLSPKLRAGANALNVVAFAASGAGGSAQGAVTAVGALAEAIAATSKEARLAAAATGIGAVAVVIGIIVSLVMSFQEKAKELRATFKGLTQDLTEVNAQLRDDELGAKRAAIVRAGEEEILQLKEKISNKNDLAKATQLVYDKMAKQIALATRDKSREVAEATLTLQKEAARTAEQRYNAELRLIELERTKAVRAGVDPNEAAAAAAQKIRDLGKPTEDSIRRLKADIFATNAQLLGVEAQRKAALDQTYADELEGLKDMTLKEGERAKLTEQYYLKRKAGLAILAEEIRLVRERATIDVGLAAVGFDEVSKHHDARLAQIKAERDAAIKSGVDVATAEAAALQSRMALQAELRSNLMSDLKALEDATISSKNREIQAIGMAARTARRLELGYKGAENAVDSIKEAGKALGYAASGDFGAAALSGMSSVKHAAAAALAFKEAGGGGGGGDAGGGGGGGGGGPRESTRLGAGGEGQKDSLKIEIVYVQKDSEGRETARVRQQIQRLDDRNQPIRMSV